MLEIKNIHAKIGNKEILKGLSLNIKPGKIHVIMGPNGSGKSTLCNVLMGHPKYKVTKGSVKLDEKNLLNLKTHERSHAGLFLAFQQPTEIPGVTFGNFLRSSKNAKLKANDKNSTPIGPVDFIGTMKKATSLLKIDEKFIGRQVNKGFSGGEKKKAEIAQMAVLEPKYALLDEIDSGLDIDALKIVAKSIKNIHKKDKTGIILITHYQRILNYITPDHVHVIADGKIVKSGGPKLAQDLEKNGYDKLQNYE